MSGDFVRHVLLADGIGLAVFFVGGIGDGGHADRSAHGARGLRFATDRRRLQWARELTEFKVLLPAAIFIFACFKCSHTLSVPEGGNAASP